MKNILKKFLFIFILLAISITSISLADNETTNYDNEVVPISMDSDIPVDVTSSQDEQSINSKNYFYAGTDDVNLTTPIVGDAFIVTAGNVNIDTTIMGNAFICASSVTVSNNASIQSSLFNVANSLNIIGSIGINVYNISSEFSLDGTVKNSLFSTSKTSNINGDIYGDANLSAENITISDNSYIENNLNYSSDEIINLPDNVVHGKVNYSLINTDEDDSFDSNDFIFSVISFIIFAIVIFAISKWLNFKFVETYPDFIKNLPSSLLYGFLGLIVTPILCIALLISGVTVSLAFILMAIYFVSLIIASSVVIIILSKLIAEKLHTKFDKNITLLEILSITGLGLIYKLLQLVPILGIIISFVVVLTGIGVLIKNIIPTKEQKNS